MKHLGIQCAALAAASLMGGCRWGATAAPQQDPKSPATGAAATAAAANAPAANAAAVAAAHAELAVPLPASAETLRAVAGLSGVKPENVAADTGGRHLRGAARIADIVYMTRDGKYAFTGDLYQVPDPRQSDRGASA